MNFAILHYKTDMACTRQIWLAHVSNNCHVQIHPFIPCHFDVFMKNPKTSASVSFEFGVDVGRIPCNDMVFFLKFVPLTKRSTLFYHHNGHLLGVVTT